MQPQSIDGHVSLVETRYGPLAYRRDGSGPAILMCQRFRGTIDDWDAALVAALTGAGCTVIRFDSAGVGRSGGTTPTSIPGMADVAIAFMDAIGLARAHVLGWSMGGQVAQWMGLTAPHRIDRLVLAGTSPGAITEVQPDPKVAAVRSKPVNDLDDILFLFFADSDASRAAGRASMARITAASGGPATQQAAIEAQIAASKAYGAGPDAVRPRLGELHMPILVANGTADRMLPAFASFVIATQAPDARLVLYPDSGHAFLFQYAEAFAGEVARFLSGPA